MIQAHPPPLSARAERAAVKRLAGEVDAARLALARRLPPSADLDPEVDALLAGLWSAHFFGRELDPMVDPQLWPHVNPQSGSQLGPIAALLAHEPSLRLAVRLATAHELTIERHLRRRGRGVSLVASGTRRRKGVYYTPPDVVEWIVEQSLGAILTPWERKLSRARGEELLAKAKALRVLDPACGGGAFLLGALGRLRRFYDRLGEVCDAPELRTPGRLALEHNLHGVDVDGRALGLAELVLLAAVQDEPGESAPLASGCLLSGDHLQLAYAQAFPRAFDRDDPGFDVVLGNPPYAPLTTVQRAAAAHSGLVTADAPDIYITFVEGLHRLARRSGRGGMIVPLSLVFSRSTRALRERIILASNRGWLLASFDRIPSGLFGASVRTRTTIAIMGPVADESPVTTTRLLRFTAADRATVFERIEAYDAAGLCHPRLGLPKLGSELQADWLRRLCAGDHGLLRDGLQPASKHRLHFKQNCYAFAIVTTELPPSFDDADRPVPQTKYSSLGFPTCADRDAALALTAGRWLFWWWLTYGDGFDMTGQLIGAFPADPRRFSATARAALARLGRKIMTRVRKHVSFKKNGGKRIGTFDLRACRTLTDQADLIVARELGAEDLLTDVRALLDRTHGAG